MKAWVLPSLMSMSFSFANACMAQPLFAATRRRGGGPGVPPRRQPTTRGEQTSESEVAARPRNSAVGGRARHREAGEFLDRLQLDVADDLLDAQRCLVEPAVD